MKNWHESFKPITKGSNRNHVITFDSHLKTALKMAAVIAFSFKERFLRFQLLFSDFYHLHHVIWGMKRAKKPKTKNGQNKSSGPFSHDTAHMCFSHKQHNSRKTIVCSTTNNGKWENTLESLPSMGSFLFALVPFW